MDAFRAILRTLVVNAAGLVGGFAITLGLFLVLPVLEAITALPPADLLIRDAGVAALPPPPPPPPPEEKEEEKAEDEPPPPPKLAEETPPLDLSQLELALNVGMGGAGGAGDFAVKLQVDTKAAAGAAEGGDDALFSLSDLDQKPRVIFQPSPSVAPKLRKKTPATVHVIFTVDPRGRVENPLVQSSSNPEFDAAALAAVKQWKFEPGKRGGQPVRFRMRVPITFPKGS